MLPVAGNELFLPTAKCHILAAVSARHFRVTTVSVCRTVRQVWMVLLLLLLLLASKGSISRLRRSLARAGHALA